jgi:hypothetical protein
MVPEAIPTLAWAKTASIGSINAVDTPERKRASMARAGLARGAATAPVASGGALPELDSGFRSKVGSWSRMSESGRGGARMTAVSDLAIPGSGSLRSPTALAKLALKAGWDEAMFGAEIGDLQTLGFDLALTGFEIAEIEGLLAADVPSATEEAADATRAGANHAVHRRAETSPLNPDQPRGIVPSRKLRGLNSHVV